MKEFIKYIYTPIGIMGLQENNDSQIISAEFIDTKESLMSQICYNDKLNVHFLALKKYFTNETDPENELVFHENLTDFSQNVFDELRKIKFGETKTYSDLARKAGNSKAFRAVGNILSKNNLLIFYPCHRVVSKSGFSSYKGGLWRKKYLLFYETGIFKSLGLTHKAVELTDYNQLWPVIYKNEKSIISELCADFVTKIHHIGSTSVPGMKAKPIIDILCEVNSFSDEIKSRLLNLGFRFVEEFQSDWQFFIKGYDDYKFIHLHLSISKSSFTEKHLIFRDNLIKYKWIADEYISLKQNLRKELFDKPKEYTFRKTEFIKKYSTKRL